ncbi:hypothetical protein [Azotobacter chroococcum]|uniref:hypothetical protein n=1 Tax=Azotobacter chroococcum TaxID=353 RepID=UPI0010AE0896|nr:hypothetical protein [Azotobacter chroococcum]TKD35297.1 hypothetical protein FCG41_17815 [Azotobacter chroococcum]
MQSTMIELELWHRCIGQHLTREAPENSVQPSVPTRLKKGVGPNRIGAGIDAHYIASASGSFLIGKIEMANRPGLQFIPSEETTGQRFIAHWLIHEAPLDETWMIGVIGKANALPSLKLSQPPVLCRYCEANSGLDFNLEVVRNAHSLMGDLPWKKTIAPAIHLYSRLTAAVEQKEQEDLKEKLNRMFVQTPELRKILRKLGVQPLSGEYEVLSWYNRER